MAASSSPFSQVVVAAMRRLYPEKLADSSFDNTGLLLEAPFRPHLKNSALLTIDLTTDVADEAIKRKDSIIIAYHPIIFRPLKALTLANSQQSTLLRLATEGISVYCPHTAVDAAPNGLNEWLADIVTGQSAIDHKRQVINPVTAASDIEGAGYGRIVTFKETQTLGDILTHIMEGLSTLHHVNLAVPQSVPYSERFNIPISSIGICAGSGGSMLNGLNVDMLFTGELSHHEALAATEQGRVVVTTYHSNSERGYLKERMQHLLDREIRQIIDDFTPDEKFNEKLKQIKDSLQIVVSKVDRDPFVAVGRKMNRAPSF